MVQYARAIAFVILPFIVAAAHVGLTRNRSKARMIEVYMLYVLGITVGLNGIFSFVGHFFFADMVARSIGWPVGHPFQLEVAFTNLALGVLGLIALWQGRGFRLATVIAVTIFLLGAGVVHLMDIAETGNQAPGNGWVQIASNFLRPAILWGLLLAASGVRHPAKDTRRGSNRPLDWPAWRQILRTGVLFGGCFLIGGLVAGQASGDWLFWLGTTVTMGLALGAGIQIARLKITTNDVNR